MKKVTIITGANRGIGLDLACKLQDKNFEVIALCRKSSEELNKIGCQIIENVDVTSSQSIKKVGEKLKDKKIDLLINNAGIWSDESLNDLDESGIDQIKSTFEVNTYGQLRVTHTLLPLLKNPSKIVFITSRMGSITDNTSGGRYGYRMSKVALNMMAKSLAFDLKDQKIAVGILHPGYVQTRMTDFSGNISPEEATEGLIKQTEKLDLNNSGTFWHSNGEELPW